MCGSQGKTITIPITQEELLKEHTRHQKNVNKKNQEIKELLQEVIRDCVNSLCGSNAVACIVSYPIKPADNFPSNLDSIL